MPETVTNYPVMLKDRDGNDVVVYYAPSKSKQEKFMMTQKFENAMRNGFEFI
jgi:hypothetical protein